MSSKTFTDRQIEILRLLRDKRSGSERDLFDAALNGTLTREWIDPVVDMINAEFLMEGIEKDYEPNSYGIELENLLDVVNRPRVQRNS